MSNDAQRILDEKPGLEIDEAKQWLEKGWEERIDEAEERGHFTDEEKRNSIGRACVASYVAHQLPGSYADGLLELRDKSGVMKSAQGAFKDAVLEDDFEEARRLLDMAKKGTGLED